LDYLYIQQMPQEEAAEQLAISDRQLRREQSAGIQALADYLWDRHELARKVAGADAKAGSGPGQDDGATLPHTAADAGSSFQMEATWLKEPREAIADLGETLRRLYPFFQPIAAAHRARLAVGALDGLPPLALHPIALRQILLKLLSLALARSEGGQVQLSAVTHDNEVAVVVRVVAVEFAASHPDENTSLAAIAELLALCGCRLNIADAPGPFAATLWLPIYALTPVLAVDDNLDALQLFQRYVADTRYRLIAASDPAQIPQLAEKHMPQAIVLDVMMPEVDGWEVLARLRQHPSTARIPVIICSVLADANLAAVLGATAVVAKPVTRQAFLSVLDQTLAQSAVSLKASLD
jgi:CheY-like chemotaxis protein